MHRYFSVPFTISMYTPYFFLPLACWALSLISRQYSISTLRRVRDFNSDQPDHPKSGPESRGTLRSSFRSFSCLRLSPSPFTFIFAHHLPFFLSLFRKLLFDNTCLVASFRHRQNQCLPSLTSSSSRRSLPTPLFFFVQR